MRTVARGLKEAATAAPHAGRRSQFASKRLLASRHTLDPFLYYCQVIVIFISPKGGGQSHYREVERWKIFMEQELRFGLDLGRFGNF